MYALSGLDIAEASLNRNVDTYRPGGVTSDYRDGEYYISVTGPTDGPVTITATGNSGDVSTTISATYDITDSGSGTGTDPPIFIDGGLTGGNSVELYGNGTVTSPANINAGVHSDNDLKIEGSLRVTGFGSAVAALYNDSGDPLSVIFQPRSNPDGDPITQVGGPTRNPPRPDGSEILPVADNVINGNAEWSGIMNMGGSQPDPEIWYYHLGVITKGDVIMNGHAIVFISESLEIEHDLRVTGNIAFYVYDDVKMKEGTVNIKGILYSGNTMVLDASGSLELTGNVVSSNNILLYGDYSVGYSAAEAAYFEPMGYEATGEGESSERVLSRTSIRMTSN